MEDFKIRYGKMEDLESCSHLFNMAFERNSDIDTLIDYWSAAINHNILKILVVELNDLIIAFSGLTVYNEVGYIGYLSVDPVHQRKGIGKKLFEQCVTLACQLNLEAVHLFASNKGVNLYEKLGFQRKFVAHRCKITSIKKATIDDCQVQIDEILTEWMVEKDRNVVGYNRKKFLSFLLSRGGKVYSYMNRSFAIIVENLIGPIISDNEIDASILIQAAFTNNVTRIITTEEKINNLSNEINIQMEERGSCIFMTYGENIDSKLENIYGYYSFGTG